MSTPGAPLPTVPRALSALDDHGIRWCVWKGSTHVDASLAGEGDVDVVLGPDADPAVARRCLRGAGLREARSRRGAATPVQDWFGVADGSGALVHLQVYESVVVDDGLAGRWLVAAGGDVVAARRAGAHGLWLPDPAHEAALVVLQAAARRGGRVRRRFTPTKRPLDARLAALGAVELAPAAGEAVRRWTGSASAAEIVTSVVSRGEADLDELEALGAALDRACAMAPDRRRALVRKATATVRRRGSRSTDRYPRDRVLGPPGVAVAVVGSDGAGKSSTVECLVDDYRRRVDTTHLYFGSGNGRSLLFLRPVKALRCRASSPASPEGRARPGAARAVWAVALTLERRAKARRLAQARAAGSVVICDRLPQAAVPGIHDGPRLGPVPADAPGWIRAVSRWEQRSYDRFASAPIDLVLRLCVSHPVASARRPDHDPADLRRRIEVVRDLDYGVPTKDLDADADRDAVRLAARLAVFDVLP